MLSSGAAWRCLSRGVGKWLGCGCPIPPAQSASPNPRGLEVGLRTCILQRSQRAKRREDQGEKIRELEGFCGRGCMQDALSALCCAPRTHPSRCGRLVLLLRQLGMPVPLSPLSRCDHSWHRSMRGLRHGFLCISAIFFTQPRLQT